MKQSFTTESVCRGHPDKIADQIAEYLLDFLVSKDPESKCGIEVLVMGHMIIIGGEVKSKVALPNVDCNWKHIIQLIKEIGYCENTWPGLNELIIKFEINEQSEELQDLSKKGAGDNCTVYGMATDSEISEYMPVGHQFASIYMRTLAEDEHRTCYGPDGKIQVTEGIEGIKNVVLCLQAPGREGDTLVPDVLSHAMNQVGMDNDGPEPEWDCRLFDKGGPRADTGLTGRKLMVDTYGTYSAHGGGAFAGKDASKPDKTLALFARYLCKNIVRLNYCETISLQISTTIGREEGFDYDYQALGTDVKHYDIADALEFFSKYTLADIIRFLRLKEVKFAKYAHGGYFGRTEKDAFWERMKFPKQFFDKAQLDKEKAKASSGSF